MQQTFAFPYRHRAPAVALTRAGRRTRGFTLIELMVSMVIGLLVVLAAVAALLVARNGFTATDAASQLRDNARFAVLALDRIGVQSGFKDVAFATFFGPVGFVNKQVSVVEQVDDAPPTGAQPDQGTQVQDAG